VGNASNAAISAARLGLNSALRAYVGDDRFGPECLDVLKSEKVDRLYGYRARQDDQLPLRAVVRRQPHYFGKARSVYLHRARTFIGAKVDLPFFPCGQFAAVP